MVIEAKLLSLVTSAALHHTVGQWSDYMLFLNNIGSMLSTELVLQPRPRFRISLLISNKSRPSSLLSLLSTSVPQGFLFRSLLLPPGHLFNNLRGSAFILFILHVHSIRFQFTPIAILFSYCRPLDVVVCPIDNSFC